MKSQRLSDADHDNGRRTGIVFALAAAACAVVAVVALHRRSGPTPPPAYTARPTPPGDAGRDDGGDPFGEERERRLRYDYNCWGRRAKKCKQAVACRWDAVADLCAHRLPGTFDPGDAPGVCQGKNRKQCKKVTGCKLWGPNLDVCVGVPAGAQGGGGGGDSKPVQLSGGCGGRMKGSCKDDERCEWSRKKNQCEDGDEWLKKMASPRGDPRKVAGTRDEGDGERGDQQAYVRIASSNVADVVPVARQGP